MHQFELTDPVLGRVDWYPDGTASVPYLMHDAWSSFGYSEPFSKDQSDI